MEHVNAYASERWRSERGASLIEAIVAAAVVITIAAGVAHVLLWARRSVWSAGASSTASLLAVQKMEQLRALEWSVDGTGLPRSDGTTNLAYDPARTDGSGLRASPPGVLERNTPGYVDYVDARGQWCGTGSEPPGAAVFVRRWAVDPFMTDGGDTLVLSVLVLPVADLRSGGPVSTRGAQLQTIKTRVPW